MPENRTVSVQGKKVIATTTVTIMTFSNNYDGCPRCGKQPLKPSSSGLGDDATHSPTALLQIGRH